MLVRDILHALLVPVVELFDKAVALAMDTTSATNVEDLEYAFAGQGRSAFLWLQCFLAADAERDWCYTTGCPGCVIEHSLDSEFCVRMLYAACLLSDVHYPFTLDGPKLPSFSFFLGSLENALAKDALYGEDFFERMQAKAAATRNGIEELIHQCIELELSLSQSQTAVSSPELENSMLQPLSPATSNGSGRVRVQRGYVARRQKSLQLEEEQWMTEMLKKCWIEMQSGEQGTSARPTVDSKVVGETVVAVDEIPAVA